MRRCVGPRAPDRCFSQTSRALLRAAHRFLGGRSRNWCRLASLGRRSRRKRARLMRSPRGSDCAPHCPETGSTCAAISASMRALLAIWSVQWIGMNTCPGCTRSVTRARTTTRPLRLSTMASWAGAKPNPMASIPLASMAALHSEQAHFHDVLVRIRPRSSLRSRERKGDISPK